jgi:hypothetical protein
MLLDEIGFDWNPRDTAWQKQYQRLIGYRMEHGDCNVPVRWENDPPLANWVATQRAEKAILTDDRRNALDSLGFDWNRRKSYAQSC